MMTESSSLSKFKLKIITHDEKLNNPAAVCFFSVNEWQVHEQKQKKQRGIKAEFLALEQALNIWVIDKCWHGFLATLTCIQFQALHLVKKLLKDPKEFKGSPDLWNILTCVLRQKTKHTQKLPLELENKIK